MASRRVEEDISFGDLQVVSRLFDWKKTQIRHGFKLTNSYGPLYVPVDLSELIIEFAQTVPKQKSK